MRSRLLMGVTVSVAAILALLPHGAEAVVGTVYDVTVVGEGTGASDGAVLSGVDEAGWIVGFDRQGGWEGILTGTADDPVFTALPNVTGLLPRVNARGTTAVTVYPAGRYRPAWVEANGVVRMPDIPTDAIFTVAGIGDDDVVAATAHSADPSCEPGITCPIQIVEIAGDGSIVVLEDVPLGRRSGAFGHEGEWTVGYAQVGYVENTIVPVRWGRGGRRDELALPDGWTWGFAWDVNEQGVAVGLGTDREGNFLPIRWASDGTIELLRVPRDFVGLPTAIADSGDAVGIIATVEVGTERAVVWPAGSTEVIDVRSRMGRCDGALLVFDIAADGSMAGVVARDGDVTQAVALRPKSTVQALGSRCHGVAGTGLGADLLAGPLGQFDQVFAALGIDAQLPWS